HLRRGNAAIGADAAVLHLPGDKPESGLAAGAIGQLPPQDGSRSGCSAGIAVRRRRGELCSAPPPSTDGEERSYLLRQVPAEACCSPMGAVANPADLAAPAI